MLQDGKLHKQDYEGIYLNFLNREEAKEVLEKYHDKYNIEHGSTESTTHQILRLGYYLPTLFKDTLKHVHSFYIFQTISNRERNLNMPLQPIFEVHYFSKWGLDFIGPVNPPSFIGYMFILIAIDYCTSWREVEIFWNCTTQVATYFIEEHIVTRFGMPFFPECDKRFSFVSIFLTQWALDNQVIIKFSSNYFPQGNGLLSPQKKTW